jgi:predicted nucleotidyltransferase
MEPLPRDEILRIAREHGVESVRVFGSFARGEARPDSDLDLLVRMAPGRDLVDLVAFSQALRERLRRMVDVVTEAGLSPFLRERILREARVL